MEEQDRTDPSPIEAVANARLALRDAQTRLHRLLASKPSEAELTPARREIGRVQAVLEEAIRARDLALRKRT